MISKADSILLVISISLMITRSSSFTGVTSKCLHLPIDTIPNGCAVSNLAVFSGSRNSLMISDWKCNQTVDSSDFDYPPIIRFLNSPIAFQKNQTYLVAVVDKTVNQLLWLVANVTASNKTLTPGSLPWHGPFKNSLIIKSYQPPPVTFASNNHSIEFLVFEEKFQHPNALLQMMHSTYEVQHHFSLRSWLQSQMSTGQVTFCGPAGGGIAIALKRHTSGPLYPSPSHNNPRVPSPDIFPIPASQPYNPHPLNIPSNPSYPNLNQPFYHTNHPSHGVANVKGNLKGNSVRFASNITPVIIAFGFILLLN